MRKIYRVDGNEWSYWDEMKARFRTCNAMLQLAWMSLWTPSALFAAIIFNVCRQEGEDIITGLKIRGKEYKL